MWHFVIVIVASYLAGSVPTSIIASRYLRGIDIRKYGSGNAGGTNAVRILGWKPGIAVMAVDVFKGVAATLWIAPLAFGTVNLEDAVIRLCAGSAAIAGHIWTVFAGFRGGKGVGTGAGVLLVLYPFAFLICLIVFLVSFAATRIVAIGSMAAALSFPVTLSILRYGLDRSMPDSLYAFGFAASLLIIVTHRKNIAKIIDERHLKGESRKTDE